MKASAITNQVLYMSANNLTPNVVTRDGVVYAVRDSDTTKRLQFGCNQIKMVCFGNGNCVIEDL
jgi:hypothetical protein